MDRAATIAILGAGNVGASLGRIWSGRGREIIFGASDPKSVRIAQVLARMPGKARAVSHAEAARSAGVVVLSVPWQAAKDVLAAAGALDGKILVDCTNPLEPDLSGLHLGLTTSAAESVAEWAPGAEVVKAFNTIGAACFGAAEFGGQRADGFYCGDSAAAKDTVRVLIEEAGLNPVDVGGLKQARLLEPLAMLWIDLAVHQGWGANHGFKLLRR